MADSSLNSFGLSVRDMATIISVLKSHTEIKHVLIFGSRAKGNYHPGSDIDLAIMNSNVSPNTLGKIQDEFKESNLPYFVDLVDFTTLNHDDLKDHIMRVGKEFYSDSIPDEATKHL
jgi:predicted nucleotidyltransferase